MIEGVAWMVGVGGIGWLGALWVARGGAQWGWVARPSERSSHQQPTPTGGGVGFVIGGTAAALLLAAAGKWPMGTAVAGWGALLAMVGAADDRYPLSPWLRLAVQAACVAGVVGAGVEEWDLKAAAAWVLGVAWVNFFNFMDGIDGLAGSEGVFLLTAGALLAVSSAGEMASGLGWWMATCAAGVAGFLVVNWPPARVFMGDLGSTWLGLAIWAGVWETVAAEWVPAATWAILLGVFVTDAAITLAVRLGRGARFYEAHRSHAYQRLSRRWQERTAGHRWVTVGAMAINGGWLLPLAVGSFWFREWGWILTAVAYAPLVAIAWYSGAGREEE
ncbi:MAG: hypothetical protein N2557_01600 [Hydrogenophilus sp.]|nr:hypothetical protein [Hydrogenophilus sp.]